MQDRDIDDLLALAARNRPEPSAGLMERVLADGLAAQQRSPARPHPRRAGPLVRLAELFGGMPALAGLVSSVLLGLAVGYLNPGAADYLTGALAASETLDLFPTTDFLTIEG